MVKTSNSKKKSPMKWTFIGLWISAVALVVTVLLLIVKLLSLAEVYTLPNTQTFNWILIISGALCVLGLALFALLEPQRVRELITGRQARYGSNAVILLLSFLGILLVLNLLAFQNPGTPLDLTEDKQNSLSTETVETLKALPASVEATAFYTSQTPSATARKLLENYRNQSNGKFDFSFLDPDQNPLAARQAGITGDGKIYLQMGDQHEIVSFAGEQDITSALVRLMNPGQRVIYFLTGHGEHDILKASDSAYFAAITALEAKNYVVKSLNLIVLNKIPDDATIIIVAGPTQPVTSSEGILFQDFVKQGGSLVVLLEPDALTQGTAVADPLEAYLTEIWGIGFNHDIVIDTNTSQPLYAVAATYATHPITEKLQGLVSFFPTARGITIDPGFSTQPEALVATANSAWGETDDASLQANGQVIFDPSSDIPGPLTLAVAVSDTNTGSHLVVFGDSDFPADLFFNQYANGDLFINAVDWAAGQEQLINLSTTTAVSRTMVLPSNFWLLFMTISFLCLLPGLVIAAGVVSWLMRRSKG